MAENTRMIGYNAASFYDAGVIYCPYIELQMIPPIHKSVWRACRKEYLMRCPSAPHACTGECHTAEYAQRVEEILKREFND